MDVTHPASVPEEEISRRLEEYPFREARRLLESCRSSDEGIDLLVEAVDWIRRARSAGSDPILIAEMEEFFERLILDSVSMISLLHIAVDGLKVAKQLHGRRELDLLDELEERATEYTDMLEKMEEMVVLLEEARQAEVSARNRLFAQEEALMELQRCRDEEQRERDGLRHVQRNLAAAAAQQNRDDAEEEAALLGEEPQLEELQQRLRGLEEENNALKEEMTRRSVSHKEAMESLNNKIAALMVELEVKGLEYTDTLGKLEEFVGLLEGARQAEKAALLTLERREQELFDLQAAHDEEMQELESAMRQLESAVETMQDDRHQPTVAPSSITAVETVEAGDPHDDNNSTEVLYSMRQQLERLKREKEALVVELEVKGRQHDDAMDVLNRNIGDLMGELDSRIRGCQVSATSAKELLREISLLRTAEEEAEEDSEEGEREDP
ncbi:hypothetical protein DQ04_09781000 [Trypanosoma grayi]|uniref:hypothetical protein n=1 Tax=Trypanosoma grayi TaxID=71804 RepID=UPI0004F4344D|nr:hypothetical protein DQ04_09781000 [Trypanosoma grayi]KEG07443.1 hypothetical protein DQ04_09781000 [Trypanosoma grayi]